MAQRRSLNTGMSETAVFFYDSGGHSHDGQDSSLIDVNKYSIFDFGVNTIYTTNDRAINQDKNIRALKNFIVNTVNNNVLAPAGITLGENVINGYNIIARSIRSENIGANQITSNEILAGTITTLELATDSIKSLNYSNPLSNIYSDSGTFFDLANGDIFSENFSLVSGSLRLRGNLYGNKTGYSDTTNGYFLGEDGGNYKLNIGNSSTNIKWDGSSLTTQGATITGGVIQTSTSGERVVISNNRISLYAPSSAGNTAAIYFDPPTNLYNGVIQSTGSILISTAAGNFQIGYHSGVYSGVYSNMGYESDNIFEGTLNATLDSTHFSDNWNQVQFIAQNISSDGAAIALRGGNDTGTVQLRVNYNSQLLRVRNYNNTAWVNVQAYDGIFNEVFLSGQGIKYNGLLNKPAGATANYTGFTWDSPNMYGLIDNGAATFVVGTSSDRRVKTNILPFENGLDVINSFNTVSFNPIQNISFEGGIVSVPDDEYQILGESRVGLIADEVKSITPWLVIGDANESQIQSVDYSGITPLLIRAVQELSERIEALEAQLP